MANLPEGDPLVLVTGASGYIAIHVVQQLLQQGYRVRGTVRSLSNREKVDPLLELCPEARVAIELVETDLNKDEGWLEAVEGCTYVIHTASPFIMAPPEHEDELVRPAVDGTRRVMEAVRKAGGVKRVVVTSSIVTACTLKPGVVIDENNWLDLEEKELISAYSKSKLLAERAAWDFMENLNADVKFELSVVNPGLVMGPPLCRAMGESMNFVKALMEHAMPMVPNAMMSMTDVRDIALAHIKAMVLPEAEGNRHIIATETVWLLDVAKILDEVFRPQGYDVPTTTPPGGKEITVDTSRMRNVLKITPTPLKKTMLDMVYHMIDAGLIKKTDKYNGKK